MNSTGSTRFKELADRLGLSVRQLEFEIGVQPSRLSKAIARDSKINLEIVYKIVDKYPHVNKDWLLSGEGDMFLPVKSDYTEPQLPAHTEPEESAMDLATIRALKHMTERYKKYLQGVSQAQKDVYMGFVNNTHPNDIFAMLLHGQDQLEERLKHLEKK